MFANILIAVGFLGTGILIGLGIAAYAKIKGESKKSETKKINGRTVVFVYDN